ncbi:MAG TPA: PEP/pyruvate-binding domain-containing protein, partial [Methylomirabilota bacterium]|nr:PEP/pyruvate-binding domain-containing protein [Methylomirabilota bacterium]
MARNKSNRRQVAFLFGEGNCNTAALLGGKGAGLAELVSLGMPVPPGFTVTTSVARAFAQHRRTPGRLAWHVERGMAAIERQTGKRFGDPGNPLLVSVRSGAAVSMPGMMDTVLNLGMNQEITRGLAAVTGPRFAWDCYRRFLAMFGEIVLGIPRSFFAEIIDKVKADRGLVMDSQLSANALEQVCQEYRTMMELLERPMIDEPQEQLEKALVAVLESWNNPRAREYRRINRIPGDLGTAVNVQAMVFGNRDSASGTGVAFSHNCNTGEPGLWGEFLADAQGEDVVAGSRTPMPIAGMADWNPELYSRLEDIVGKLAAHRNHVVDVEFTVESGRLYILQVRAAKLAPEAAVTIATHLVWEERATRQEALALVPAEHVQALKTPAFNPRALELA